MVTLQDLKRITDYEWEIPKSYREDMQVPVRLFATRRMLEAVMKDKSLEQAVNAATLPGLVGHVVVMPDMHQGYGFPIGGVAATRLPDGIISPGGIGYDINCGVRLLGSQISFENSRPYLDDLATVLNQYCPSGVGGKGAIHVTEAELESVCHQGARRSGRSCQRRRPAPHRRIRVDGADLKSPNGASGRPQLGSLGAGNHFIEVDLVEQAFDTTAASVMGLAEATWQYKHRLASFNTRFAPTRDEFQSAVRKYGIRLLTGAGLRPLSSRQNYLRCAVPPTMLSSIARFWLTVPEKPLSTCWQAR
jgi:tRNA-splicing ligase RtcB